MRLDLLQDGAVAARQGHEDGPLRPDGGMGERLAHEPRDEVGRQAEELGADVDDDAPGLLGDLGLGEPAGLADDQTPVRLVSSSQERPSPLCPRMRRGKVASGSAAATFRAGRWVVLGWSSTTAGMHYLRERVSVGTVDGGHDPASPASRD